MAEKYKKKLIEVAIPLEAINAASAREKSIRHGHPSTLHLWWARRPLAACRAVLFAQLVDDPSSHPDRFPTPDAQEAERKRLFQIIEDLVKWENSTNEEVLERARAEIRNSCDGKLPPVYDPFSGGGSIPLEAQRLGLPAYGSDLNPVAVMIGKAMIEIPPKFKDMPPIHPGPKARGFYRNAEGLAEDVKYYGERMRKKAWERIGHLYPQVDLSKEYGGGKATVIAWIWARTVPSPDPAFSDVQVPIASSFLLSSKAGKTAMVEPVVDKASRSISFKVHLGVSKHDLAVAQKGTKAGSGANFTCLLSDAAITADYVRKCAQRGQMGQKLVAVIAEGPKGRAYVAATPFHEDTATNVRADWKPDLRFEPNALGFRVGNYGMENFGDLFTERQVSGLNSFVEAVQDVRKEIEQDATAASAFQNDNRPLYQGGIGSIAYADALATYLSFLIGQLANHGSTICGWNSTNSQMRSTFSRQALPMTWDFAECNFFSESSGSFESLFTRMVKGFETLAIWNGAGSISQLDAQTADFQGKVISTDPPYYDNIGYADLSDFFYVWMRKCLREVYPDIMGVLMTPKKEELVATPVRHGGRQSADDFFLKGMTKAVSNMAIAASGTVPVTIYYAFKQSEIDQEGISSTGWATFLNAVVKAGFAVVGTWPIRTEKPGRMRAVGSNALANSVVLVCRKKETSAEIISRAEFIRALKRELPPAIAELQAANIAPADMPQSAIGPGMGVFSRYKAVLEADDSPMTVKTALQLINRELDEFLNDVQGEFDTDTRFAITWFEQNGMGYGDYGIADNLARARGISVEKVKHAGIVECAAGKVRILKRDELLDDWDPATDAHLTVWECCQYLIRKLEMEGEYEAAVLLKKIGPDRSDAVKDLAYCLYDICSNKRKDAKEATSYNALIAVWTELTRQAASIHETDLGGDRQSAMNF